MSTETDSENIIETDTVDTLENDETPTPEVDTPEPPEAPEAAPEAGKAAQEAARYRRQLRDTQAERDALTARLATLQTREVERLATGPGGLSLGADLWHSSTLEAMLDDEGNVDPGKVTTAVADLITTHHHYSYRPRWGSADAGFRGTGAEPAAATWGSVLRG